MQLFILGPAFGVPSIEAECAAAVALLQLYVRDGYELIAAHDQRRLPHLINGPDRASGFNNIVRYLAEKRFSPAQAQAEPQAQAPPSSQSQTPTKALLDDDLRATACVLTTFVESHAQTLLDISLYVGFENYRLATRPAFTKILPWHQNYIFPPNKRSVARNRTEYLGISSIDVDNVHEDMSHRPQGWDGVGKEQPSFEAEAKQRASLILPRKETVRTLLQRPEHAAIFRLNALADNFFGPLQGQLGDNQYLLGTSAPTAVDCLMYGYLALMLFPELPQNWLAFTLRDKYKKLTAYIQRLHEQFDLSVNVDDVVRLYGCATRSEAQEHRTACNMKLPWAFVYKPTALESVKEIYGGIWGNIPILGGFNALELEHSQQRPFLQQNLPSVLISVVTSLAAGTYLALRTGAITWPHGEMVHIFGRKRLSDYGDVGVALAGLNFIGSRVGQT